LNPNPILGISSTINFGLIKAPLPFYWFNQKQISLNGEKIKPVHQPLSQFLISTIFLAVFEEDAAFITVAAII